MAVPDPSALEKCKPLLIVLLFLLLLLDLFI